MNENNKLSSLALANIEALASGEMGNCDATQYARNTRPDTKPRTGTATTDSQGYFSLGGVKFSEGKIGKNKNISYTYDLGYCMDSPGNCCSHSHVGKAFNVAWSNM